MNLLTDTFYQFSSRPAFGHLVRGRQYSVVRTFHDYDQDIHFTGETWTFLGSSFLPHDEGLSLFVRCDEGEYQIRLQWSEEEQENIIDNLRSYIIEYDML